MKSKKDLQNTACVRDNHALTKLQRSAYCHGRARFQLKKEHVGNWQRTGRDIEKFAYDWLCIPEVALQNGF